MEYIEVTPADIVIANKLTHEVLGRSLDELAPQTRRLLVMLDAHTTDECKRLKMRGAITASRGGTCGGMWGGGTSRCARTCKSWWTWNTS